MVYCGKFKSSCSDRPKGYYTSSEGNAQHRSLETRLFPTLVVSVHSEIDTLISKRLSVENKAKPSPLEIVNKQYCGGGVLSSQWREFRFVLYR